MNAPTATKVPWCASGTEAGHPVLTSTRSGCEPRAAAALVEVVPTGLDDDAAVDDADEEHEPDTAANIRAVTLARTRPLFALRSGATSIRRIVPEVATAVQHADRQLGLAAHHTRSRLVWRRVVVPEIARQGWSFPVGFSMVTVGMIARAIETTEVALVLV